MSVARTLLNEHATIVMSAHVRTIRSMPGIADERRRRMRSPPSLETGSGSHGEAGTAHPRAGKRNAFIGSPVERLEDLRFLRGRGQYRRRPHAPTSAACRDPAQPGRAWPHPLASTSVRRARAPGVHAVITAADIGRRSRSFRCGRSRCRHSRRIEQPVIARGKVRYVGEPIAVVVADSAALAEDALEAIALDIEPLPAVADRDARPQGDVLLFEATGSEPRQHADRHARAMPTRRFAHAPYVRRERFSVQRFTAVPMETRGLLAEWDDGDRHGSPSTAPPRCRSPTAAILAQHDGAAEEQSISMVEYDVGGGFGVRGEFYPEDFLIPFAARRLGRPVKWIEDRREHLIATQSRARRRMRAGDRLRPRRHDPRPARRRRRRSRRLYPHQRRDRGAQHRAGAVRPVPHPEHPRRRRRCW